MTTILADTLRPRLEEAGADLSRIHVIDGEVSSADVAHLAPALIVVDPLSVYLCLECSAPPRSVLKRLARLAQRVGRGRARGAVSSQGGFLGGRNLRRGSLGPARLVIGNGRNRISVAKSNLQALVELSPYVFHLDQTDDGGVRITHWADSV